MEEKMGNATRFRLGFLVFVLIAFVPPILLFFSLFDSLDQLNTLNWLSFIGGTIFTFGVGVLAGRAVVSKKSNNFRDSYEFHNRSHGQDKPRCES